MWDRFVELSANALIENEIATEKEISLVESICGINAEVYTDILYSRTGLRSFEQAKDEGFYIPDELLELEEKWS